MLRISDIGVWVCSPTDTPMRTPSLISRYVFALVAAAFFMLGTSPVAAQVVLVDFLNFPWGMTELPDGSILVAESGGEGIISRHYPDGTSEDFATDLFDVRGVAFAPGAAGAFAPSSAGGADVVGAAQTSEDAFTVFAVGGEVVASFVFPGGIAVVGSADPNLLYIFGFFGGMAVFNLETGELTEGADTGLSQIAGAALESAPSSRHSGGGESFVVVQQNAETITRVFLDGTTEAFASVDGALNGGIAALDDGSVLVTVDGGASFDPGRVVRIYPDGTQEDFATDLNFPRGLLVRSDSHVLVTNYNSGPLGALLDLGVVPVDVESGATPVAGLTVSAPSPNPTGDLLRVQVETPTPSRVRVEVYDILGRRVASSFDGVVAESVNVGIDASSLAPGLYVLQVRGAETTETRRFTVVR